MRLFYFLLLFLFSTQLVSGQEYMTLQKARKMALANSEDVKIADQQLQKAVDQKAMARTNYLPNISASARGIYQKDVFRKDYYLPTATPNSQTGEPEPNVMTDANGNEVIGPDGMPVYNLYTYLPLKISLQGAYLAGIQIDQPIYHGGKIHAANKMADNGLKLAQANQKKQKIATIVETDKAYWLYVSVQEKVRLSQSSVHMLDSLLQQVRNNYQAGMIKRNEVLKVLVKYNNALLQLQEANSGLDLSRMSLCRLTGLPFSTELKTDSLVVINDSLLVSSLPENYKLRPEYQLLNQQIQLKEQTIRETRSDFLPTIGIQAGAFRFGGVKLNDDPLNQTNYSLMASVKIPIFHWGEGRKKIAAAQADREIEKLELTKNAQLMQLQIERAKHHLKDAYFRVTISRTALKQATENLRVSRDNYDVGNELMTDLLIAQTEWQEAYSKEIDAKTNYQIYATEYLQATANLLPEENQ